MRKYGNFKYKVVKRLYNRATTFRDEADTPEKKEAWDEVTKWLLSFYGPENRCLSKNGVICLTIKNQDIEKIPLNEMEMEKTE